MKGFDGSSGRRAARSLAVAILVPSFFSEANAQSDIRRYDTRVEPAPHAIRANDSYHYASAWGFARLALLGGEIVFNVFAYERSVVTNFGIPVGGVSEAHGEAIFHIFAGATNYAISRESASVNIFGGALDSAAATGDSTLVQYGGSIGTAGASGDATCHVRGGLVRGNGGTSTIDAAFRLYGNGTLKIHGRSFDRPPGVYDRSNFQAEGTPGWTQFFVAGTLEDGSPFSWKIVAPIFDAPWAPFWKGHIHLIVEDEPQPAPLPEIVVSSGLSIASDERDSVGAGRSYFHAPALPVGPDFFASAQGAGNAVTVYVNLPGETPSFWKLAFAAPNGQHLVAGTYENAHLYDGAPSTSPSMSIRRFGSRMFSISGSFTVKHVEYDGASIRSFWAVFEQRANGFPAALRGEVRFNMPLQSEPTPTPRPTPTPVLPTPKPRPDRPKPDKRAPRVTIDGGSSNRTTPFDFAILSGRVTDDRRVKSMEIRGGGARYVRPIRGTDRWYQLVDLAPGRNVFRIRAQDAAGNFSRPQRVVVTSTEIPEG